MFKKLKNLFVDADGQLKFSYLLALAIIFVGVAVPFFIPEIKTMFTERFIPSGLIAVGATALGAYVIKRSVDYYNNTEELGAGSIRGIMVGFIIFVAGFFGPIVTLKTDRSLSIPDNNVYYSNGRVRNATDSTKRDYYFKEFSLSPVDSIYVVENGEEPGRNKNNAIVRLSPDSLKSKAPRANEDWQRPKTKNAQRLEGKY